MVTARDASLSAARCQQLRALESEAIFIFREAAAEIKRPVLLYSIGKDSSVLLHLALKSFAPSPLPFPMLHVDTTWKFREMIAFRDATAAKFGLNLIIHINQDGLARGINPFDSGSSLHTQVMKTESLKQALAKYDFDGAIGGARRDEEKSRAKERIFSYRGPDQVWDPRRQRPEFWNVYNTRLGPGASLRVFPLSNWTEADVWDYVLMEQIDVVDLYLSKRRPVVNRGGAWLMVDDNRFRLRPGEIIEQKEVRFRTLGCYPLTAAVLSDADTIEKVAQEVGSSKTSERQGRLIDFDDSSSMERKKREGYF
jgi:sulfate adenylyltransferase subunit 2